MKLLTRILSIIPRKKQVVAVHVDRKPRPSLQDRIHNQLKQETGFTGPRRRFVK